MNRTAYSKECRRTDVFFQLSKWRIITFMYLQSRIETCCCNTSSRSCRRGRTSLHSAVVHERHDCTQHIDFVFNDVMNPPKVPLLRFATLETLSQLKLPFVFAQSTEACVLRIHLFNKLIITNKGILKCCHLAALLKLEQNTFRNIWNHSRRMTLYASASRSQIGMPRLYICNLILFLVTINYTFDMYNGINETMSIPTRSCRNPFFNKVNR